MKKSAGILFLSFGHLLNILVLLAAVVYTFGLIAWMHAPVSDILQTIAMAAVVPFAVAWGCRSAGRQRSANCATRRWRHCLH
jgi:hypothetical protein